MASSSAKFYLQALTASRRYCRLALTNWPKSKEPQRWDWRDSSRCSNFIRSDARCRRGLNLQPPADSLPGYPDTLLTLIRWREIHFPLKPYLYKLGFNVDILQITCHDYNTGLVPLLDILEYRNICHHLWYFSECKYRIAAEASPGFCL